MPRAPEGEKPLTAAQRTARSRQTRQQDGKRIDVMLGQEAAEALDRLRQAGDLGRSTREIVEALLLSERKRRGKGKI